MIIKKFPFKFLIGKEYEEYQKSKNRELGLIAQRNKLEDRIAELILQIRKSEISEAHKDNLLDIDIGDPSPVDIVKRKEYVALVAGLHKDVLEPKLKQMISVSHNLLESDQTDRDFDLLMKGVIYSFREILKWGDSMVSEQIASQIGENPSAPKDNKK